MSIQLLPATARRFMNSYVVDVTPDLARRWLDLARFNREIMGTSLFSSQCKETTSCRLRYYDQNPNCVRNYKLAALLIVCSTA